jgi:hypothetical protein
LLFNSLDSSLSISIMLIFEFGLISVMLWFNLLMATNQSSRQRFNTAVTISLAIIALTLYSEINTDSDSPGNPEYVKILKPPAMQVSGSVTENDYLSSVAIVFEKFNAE